MEVLWKERLFAGRQIERFEGIDRVERIAPIRLIKKCVKRAREKV